jgi:hypothetical protein
MVEIYKKEVEYVKDPLISNLVKIKQKNMKNNIVNSVKVSVLTATILAMGFPIFSSAATYAYVNQSGQTNTVVASSPTEAIATASGISSHSGVMLVESSTGAVLGANTETTSGMGTYAYVNQAGTVITVKANSSAMAFSIAYGIDENSGVVLLSNTSSDNGIAGDYVSGV